MAKKVPIALQLYSVRGECNKDLANTIKQVAKLGYAGIEPWGSHADFAAMSWQGMKVKEFRKLLDDNGLACCGFHLDTEALVGANLCQTIEMNRILGNKFLIDAGDSVRMRAAKTIGELAGILNSAAEAVKAHGMFAGYHAHPFDFAQVDGQPAWDILFKQVQPSVIMQMDIGNCANGNGDPVAELKRFPNRAKTVHLKDFGGAPDSVIGEGKADWKEIFRLCDTLHPVEWFVVEEGGADGFGFEVSGRSLKALQAMGK